MLLSLLLLITAAPIDVSRIASERVDLIELNHFHDECGKAVYDQVIFYEWSASQAKYHVRAWCLVEPRDIVSRRPTYTNQDDRYHVRWFDSDQSIHRHISSPLYRETWTHTDPERANKRILDEKMRTGLILMRAPCDPPKVSPVE